MWTSLLLLAACTHGLPSPPAGDPLRPDVILLSIDTLRADHVGAWGYAPVDVRGQATSPTPYLDGLAASGTRFSQAWSAAPWTLPSHATILSGLLPIHHGVIEDDRSVGACVPLLQAAFQKAGYATGATVATLYLTKKYGFDRGFDHFEDFGISTEKENLTAKPLAEKVFASEAAWGASLPAGKPAFAFVHVYDAHYPYDAPAPWNGRYDAETGDKGAKYKKYEFYLKHPLSAAELAHQTAQYDEEIAYVDEQFRQFVAAWTKNRPAIVVVVADHGEELGERGSWGQAHTLWPEQLHVPMIVAGPGVAAQVVDRRAGLEDVAPTIAGLAKVPYDAVDGVDRSAAVRGTPTPVEDL